MAKRPLLYGLTDIEKLSENRHSEGVRLRRTTEESRGGVEIKATSPDAEILRRPFASLRASAQNDNPSIFGQPPDENSAYLW